MEHIETIELGSSQSSITFSSIPQSFDDLVVLISARSDRSNVVDTSEISFNGSSANFSTKRLTGNGSAVSSDTTTDVVTYTSAASNASNTFSNTSIYLSNYTSSNAKSFSVDTVSEDNATTAFSGINTGLWNDTSAITSVSFSLTTGPNYVSGTVFSLYGVTAGGDGTVTTS